ncbi:hypothetical protein NHX12_015056, partial [Muraenolepis orangiensis]
MATPFLWKLSSQKLGFFLVSFGFIWGMMLLHFTIQQRASHESSTVLKQQILDLSKRYIKALADENQSVMDGPYVGTMTAYDLKKTLAVLLDNIMLRLGKLESKVDNIYNGTGGNLTNGTGATSTAAPSAANAEKVENWCPRLPWRSKTVAEELDRRGQTDVRTSFEELHRVMSQREEFRWMMLRIKRMADPWLTAILVHLGLLTKESGFKIAENAFSGGPLGELVQWSDLITTLYLLGHDVRISASLAELKEIMRRVMGNKSSCPTQGDKVVELIYIDIVGLTQFKKTLGPSWVHYQCMLRVLDSFGTEPEFNHAHYAQAKGHKTPWGKWNLNPQQFNTMFHNSFLGFVVEQHLNASDIRHIDDDKKKYLDTIHGYMEVHGTVHGTSTVHLPQLQTCSSSSGRPRPIAKWLCILNPKFSPPKSSKNTDFFKGKPHSRSQHPYAEVYVGSAPRLDRGTSQKPAEGGEGHPCHPQPE